MFRIIMAILMFTLFGFNAYDAINNFMAGNIGWGVGDATLALWMLSVGFLNLLSIFLEEIK